MPLSWSYVNIANKTDKHQNHKSSNALIVRLDRSVYRGEIPNKSLVVDFVILVHGPSYMQI